MKGFQDNSYCETKIGGHLLKRCWENGKTYWRKSCRKRTSRKTPSTKQYGGKKQSREKVFLGKRYWGNGRKCEKKKLFETKILKNAFGGTVVSNKKSMLEKNIVGQTVIGKLHVGKTMLEKRCWKNGVGKTVFQKGVFGIWKTLLARNREQDHNHARSVLVAKIV